MNNRIIKIILLAVVFTACKKTEYVFPTGELKGNILPSGVKVTFDQGDKHFSAISDAQGDYIIQNLEMGSYNLTWEKPGYFTFKKFGYQFFGGPSTEDISDFWITELCPIPLSTIDINSMEYMDGYIKIEGIYHFSESDSLFVSPGDFPPIRWFIGDKPDVSPDNYLATFITNYYGDTQQTYPENELDITFFTTSCLVDYYSKLENLTTVYFIAFPSIRSFWMDYFDWTKKELVHGIGPVGSNVTLVTIPADLY